MFEFLKYIQPGNYYRLLNQMPQVILSFPLEVENKLGYTSELAEKMDAAFGRLQSGWIPKASDERNSLQNVKITNIGDNYIFIHRYFSKTQVLYVLLIRLFTLKNPVFEMVAFIKALKFSRVFNQPKLYPGFENVESSLLKSQPLVSVIIPTLNRYEYLKDVLKDLENQSYSNFEVIVSDQSEPIDESFYVGWNLNIQLIKQEEKALWLARNRCIKQSNGDYILLFDDDSRVDHHWISYHVKCLDFFKVHISAGVTHTLIGGGLGKKDFYFHLSDVFDTGNVMVKRNVFEKVGLFDRQFEKQRMGDSEFGIRSLLGGYLVVANPYAKRIHLKVETGGLRQMGSWDAIRPKNLLAPRPIPSVLYLIRKYHNAQEVILYLIKNIPQSYVPYRYKGNKIITLLIFTLLPCWLPLAIITVTKSWKLATVKLKQGDLIEFLV